MMNDSLNEYRLLNNFEARRDMLMEEARRERLKANVLRRARQARRPGQMALRLGGLWAGLRAQLADFDSTAIDPPGVVDDCLESSLT